jgi:hypothetical protein
VTYAKTPSQPVCSSESYPECSGADGIMYLVFAPRYGILPSVGRSSTSLRGLEVISHLVERIVGCSFAIWNVVSIIW